MSSLEVPQQSKANSNHLAYTGGVTGAQRDSDAWFTPPKYVQAARAVLGTIDLDPFSSRQANEVVKASRFYTEHDDAFTQDWTAATVWMNPPYAGRLVAAAVGMFLDQYQAGAFTAGIFLVNNATETRWFQRALRESTAVCLTDHRIAFWNADGKHISGNTRGQAFFLCGADRYQAFARDFADFGHVMRLH